ncbi:hypothetical protein HPB47_000716 [Ixodes persulcatus]|uniref:Uncharacterized protein n=1 Tax=Ixodes persulcatus TaxID=34615 RepID=A0AC60PR84_IXOPE|nr:hypothetical protein HPB47_000716 [Ixodes persulcatus]
MQACVRIKNADPKAGRLRAVQFCDRERNSGLRPVDSCRSAEHEMRVGSVDSDVRVVHDSGVLGPSGVGDLTPQPLAKGDRSSEGKSLCSFAE